MTLGLLHAVFARPTVKGERGYHARRRTRSHAGPAVVRKLAVDEKQCHGGGVRAVRESWGVTRIDCIELHTYLQKIRYLHNSVNV